MKNAKRIRKVIPSSKVNMGGVILDQPLPNNELDMVDPFLLIHHWYDLLKGGKQQQNVGVGPHPHRGFSPITFVFKGGVHHRDSRGNNSIVNAGGVQWMEAGMGIVHSERPTKALAESGGEFEIIQFWLNLPSENKFGQPRYLPLQKKDIPVYKSADNKVNVGVVAGQFMNVTGKIQHPSEVLICRMDFEAGSVLDFEIPSGHNSVIYLLDGEVTINGTGNIKNKSLVWFEKEDGTVSIKSSIASRAILLAGKPLNEKVASHGPFVMNDQTQVMEAMRDAQLGKMGVLIEEFD